MPEVALVDGRGQIEEEREEEDERSRIEHGFQDDAHAPCAIRVATAALKRTSMPQDAPVDDAQQHQAPMGRSAGGITFTPAMWKEIAVRNMMNTNTREHVRDD